MVRPWAKKGSESARRSAEEWESLTLWALNERVKELTCLYGISQLASRPELSLEEVLGGVAELLPAGWQYPAIAEAGITLDGQTFNTAAYGDAVDRQVAEIVVGGAPRGIVEVVYLEPCPELDEGPFLEEERELIDAVARQVSQIVERREAAVERFRLEEQLRHADRLATIGQLAAGVAHELNEPLGSVLGFAQLAKKSQELPGQVANDLDKIVAAALHAREIVKKLMLFVRQTPPSKSRVNVNQVVELGLYFLEARCARQRIELVRELAGDLPTITADPAQLQQVLVNLVVNALQATDEGGRVTIRTAGREGNVLLVVEDTGCGMEAERINKIFLPFFTTKEVDQGTGLGLSVVHGIVTAHGGAVRVHSRPGEGSRFEVELPVGIGDEADDEGDNRG